MTVRGGSGSALARRQQAEIWCLTNRCQQWNALVPVGTKVRYHSIAGRDLEFTDTTTRSEAWIMGGDRLVVMLIGVSGCVVCDQIRIRTEAKPASEVP